MERKRVPINMKESIYILAISLAKIFLISYSITWTLYGIIYKVWPYMNILFIQNKMNNINECSLMIFLSIILLFLLAVQIYIVVTQCFVIYYLISGKITKYVGGEEDEETEKENDL